MAIQKKRLDGNRMNLKDEVVSINRVTKVVKGGKNMSFAALVIVGDPAEGVVGYGSGKAKEVPQAIRKGIEAAKKNLIKVNLTGYTIPHVALGHYGAGEVLLKPAPEGTGIIAGKTVRAVMTAAGVQNVLTKSLGSANPHNVIKARLQRCVASRSTSCKDSFQGPWFRVQRMKSFRAAGCEPRIGEEQWQAKTRSSFSTSAPRSARR